MSDPPGLIHEEQNGVCSSAHAWTVCWCELD